MKPIQNNTPTDGGHRRPSRERLMQTEEPVSVIKRLRYRFNDWRLGFTFDPKVIWRVALTALLLAMLATLQTTMFSRFRPFGAVPDMMLPFDVAISMMMKEKWGAVTALVSGFVIDSLSGSTVTLMPLVYVAVAYAVGILSTCRYKDTPLVAAIYTATSSLLKCAVTFAVTTLTIDGIGPWRALRDVALLELCANLIFAIIVHGLTRLCFLPLLNGKAERRAN